MRFQCFLKGQVCQEKRLSEFGLLKQRFGGFHIVQRTASPIVDLLLNIHDVFCMASAGIPE
jgi:hypothetical protein